MGYHGNHQPPRGQIEIPLEKKCFMAYILWDHPIGFAFTRICTGSGSATPLFQDSAYRIQFQRYGAINNQSNEFHGLLHVAKILIWENGKKLFEIEENVRILKFI